MRCTFFEKNISNYLNGTLNAAEKETFERHCDSCTGCAKEKRDLDQLMDKIYEQDVPSPGQQYWDSFNRRVFSKIDEQIQGKRWLPQFSLRRWVMATAATAFAVIVIAVSYLFWISGPPSPGRYETAVLQAIQDATPEQAEGIAEEIAPFYQEESYYFQELDDLYANGKEQYTLMNVSEEAIIPYSLLDELDDSERALLIDQMKLEMG